MKNRKQFDELIERYNSITLEEIQLMDAPGINMHMIAQSLTGFGSRTSCTLCKSAAQNCIDCVWYNDAATYLYSCNTGSHEKSYYEISSAETPIQLLIGFRNRAAHMKWYLNEL